MLVIIVVVVLQIFYIEYMFAQLNTMIKGINSNYKLFKIISKRYWLCVFSVDNIEQDKNKGVRQYVKSVA